MMVLRWTSSGAWPTGVTPTRCLRRRADLSKWWWQPSGEMALMRTVHPLDFARIKLALSRQTGRDANKRGKDALQSAIIDTLVTNYLPTLS
jgi:Nucleotidyltransferase